jgi:hypothetical protein
VAVAVLLLGCVIRGCLSLRLRGGQHLVFGGQFSELLPRWIAPNTTRKPARLARFLQRVFPTVLPLNDPKASPHGRLDSENPNGVLF